MVKRFIKHIEVNLRNDVRILKWSNNEKTAKNVGDALNPFLFEKIFKKKVLNSSEILNLGFPPVYSFVGSTLDNSKVKNLIVIGSGFKREHSIMHIKPSKVIATRGPLTRNKLIKLGVTVPEVYGDPAILMPKFFNPEVPINYKMGIIPHYMDSGNLLVQECRNLEAVKIVNIFSELEQFISDIKQCEFTISTSLHGVILSHSYGIPSVWIKMSNKIAGGNFKFYDYFQSVGLSVEPLIINDRFPTINELKSHCTLPNINPLADNLLENLKNFSI